MRKKLLVGFVLTMLLLVLVSPIGVSVGVVDFDGGSGGFVAQSGVDWWPMFHHDPSHTGYSTSTAPNTNNIAWSYRIGGRVYSSSPAVADGRVYVGSEDDKVYCLNASTGAFIWRYTTGDMVWSSPAVVDGKVYVGSHDDKVYCLDAWPVAPTGAFIWSYTTGDDVDSSPAVADGRVYVGSNDNKVYCLNASTGAFIWRYTTGDDVTSSPAVADGKVYVGSWADKVYCLNATTGAKIWSYTTGGPVYFSSPAVADGRVYVGSFDRKVYAFGPHNVRIETYCYTEDAYVSVSIAMDGSPTGYNTPHTFTNLTGTHTFTVPSNDPQGHPFRQWSTGEKSTTITVTPAGTYIAYYAHPRWTYMVYLDADNDLEKWGIYNFLEMSAVGTTVEVNILVQMDRTPLPCYYEPIYGDWTDCKRFYVTKGLDPTPGNAIENLGEVNMGDPNTLANFMVWGIQNYPADHYVVVLWDHGSGAIKGVCFDDTDMDYLSTIELEQALATVESTTGVKVDIVGFDACLMGMTEIAYQIKDYADIMVASEEIEYAPGWPYGYILSNLTSNPMMTSSELATEIVTDCIAYGIIITMSAVNLGLVTYNATVNDLATATSNFAQTLINKLPTYLTEITQARQQTEYYEDPTYVDLYHFAQLTHTLVSDPNIQTAAEQVMNTLNDTIIAEGHYPLRPNSHGLSIYFPRLPENYSSSYEDLTFTADTRWDEFLRAFISAPSWQTYTLTITTTTGGTTDPPPGTHTYIADSSVEVTALPDACYLFDHWELNGFNVGSANPYSVIIDNNHTLHAVFAQINYTLTITATTGGTTSPVPEIYTHVCGSSVQITAIPNTDYVFHHWELDGNYAGATNPISITMNTDHALHAVFVAIGTPNVAVTNVYSRTVVGRGYSLSIHVTAKNYGSFTETFNITAYYSETNPIATKNITLTGGNSITITLTWNTTGVPCANYTITANATIVPGETDTLDNTYTDGWVLVAAVGEVNGEPPVNVLDMLRVKLNIGHLERYPNADVDSSGQINVIDILLVKLNIGATCP